MTAGDGHDDLEHIDGLSGLAGLGQRDDDRHRSASRADAAFHTGKLKSVACDLWARFDSRLLVLIG